MSKRKPKPAQAVASEASERAQASSHTIRVDPDLSRMATIVAIRRGVSVSELVSPILRPALERLYRETVQSMAKELEGEAAPMK